MTRKKTKEVERINEAEMADVVQKILKRQPNKTATFAELRELVPQYVKLSRADRAESPSRPSEQLWVQIVRNLVAHKRERFEGVLGGICLEGHAPKAEKVKSKPARKSRKTGRAVHDNRVSA